MPIWQLVTDVFKSLAGARSMPLISATRDAALTTTSISRWLALHTKGFASVILRGLAVPSTSRPSASTSPHCPGRERLLPARTPKNLESSIRTSIATPSPVPNPPAVSITRTRRSANRCRLTTASVTAASPCPTTGMPNLMWVRSVAELLARARPTAATCRHGWRE